MTAGPSFHSRPRSLDTIAQLILDLNLKGFQGSGASSGKAEIAASL